MAKRVQQRCGRKHEASNRRAFAGRAQEEPGADLTGDSVAGLRAALRGLLVRLQGAPAPATPRRFERWCLEALHRGPDLDGPWAEADGPWCEAASVDAAAPKESPLIQSAPHEVVPLRSASVPGVLRVQLALRRRVP